MKDAKTSGSATSTTSRTTSPTVPRQRGDGAPRGVGHAHPTVAERANRGIEARDALPPGEHAELLVPPDRPDPVAVLQEQATSRVAELVPVRHARMVSSPFAFFRGGAAIMSRDLAQTPDTGLTVQLCGDAHLSNFGLFASPERRLLFDVNDFDETLPGPWEWDLKRLAASLTIAGRQNGFDKKENRKVVRAGVERYQQAMARFATMRELEVWYLNADVEELRQLLGAQVPKKRRKALAKTVAKARGRDNLKALSKLTEVVDGHRQFKPDPPLVVRLHDLLPDHEREELTGRVHEIVDRYGRTLSPDRQLLLNKYGFVDIARKVVGVGSVGTRCWVVLLEGRDDGDPLLLQVKEAQASVLAPYVPKRQTGRRRPANEGQRVVTGQRIMQAASDIFLGWERVEGIDGVSRDFYIRQLRDQKGSAIVETMSPEVMQKYGELCAWTLARAHARSGDAVAISAYLGDEATFPKALARFAEAYADLNDRDYAEASEAVRTGRLPAEQLPAE